MNIKELNTTQEELKKEFHYDPETGLFKYIGLSRYVKTNPAGKHKYIDLTVNSKRLSAHRLAFLYMTGKFPELHVDHIDGNPSNNKWNNLRQVTRRENNRNNKRNREGGLFGASYCKKSKAWRANIKIGEKRYYLGRYPTKEEAHNKVLEFEKEMLNKTNNIKKI